MLVWLCLKWHYPLGKTFLWTQFSKKYLLDCLILLSVQSRSTMLEYGSSVATRGLIYSNSARARAAHQSSVGFKPLHKPHWLHINKTVMRICAKLVVRSTNECHASHYSDHVVLSSGVKVPRELSDGSVALRQLLSDTHKPCDWASALPGQAQQPYEESR